MLNSSDISLRDSVYPHLAGLVCPPVASVVAQTKCGGDVCYRDRSTSPFLQPTAQTQAWGFLPAGGWNFKCFVMFLNLFSLFTFGQLLGGVLC